MIAALLLDKHPNVPTNRMHETSASLRGVLSIRARSALFATHSLDHRASRVEHLDVHTRFFCESHRRFLRFGRDRLGNRLLLFIQSEGRRLRMRFLWLPMLGTVLVGVSLDLPFFLYLRQLELDRKAI